MHKRVLSTWVPITAVALASALTSGSAVAGGILMYEIGTSDTGLASAGYGARAQDASTVFTNVAGMTRLEGQQALFGIQALDGNVELSSISSPDPALGSNDGGDAISVFPSASAFYVYSVSHDLKLGFGLAGNFGAAVKYNDDWVGRYYVKSATLVGASILPSAAYRLNQHWSVGASLNIMPARLDQKTAINNIGPADGQVEFKDTTWGYGGNVGVMYELDPATRVGLTYNSEVRLKFANQLAFSGQGPIVAVAAGQNLAGSTVDITVHVPQQVMLSGFHQLNESLALLASVGWQQWSRLGVAEISVDLTNPRSVTTNIPFKNTWHGAGGVQYKVNPAWTLNAGVAHDTKFQSGSVTPLLPTNQTWRFGVGAENGLSKTTSWGIAAEYLSGGTQTVSKVSNNVLPVTAGGRGSFSGTFNDEWIVFVSAYLSIKF